MDKACDKLHVYCDGFVKIVIQIGFAISIFKIGIKTNVDSAITYQYKEKQKTGLYLQRLNRRFLYHYAFDFMQIPLL